MPIIKRELDFELCKKILLRLEELWDNGTHSLPAHYDIDGYNVENISYNIEKLFKGKLIEAKVSQEWKRDQLRIWPIGLTQNGWKFAEAAKCKETWAEAVEIANAQIEASGYETLSPLKVALFAGGS